MLFTMIDRCFKQFCNLTKITRASVWLMVAATLPLSPSVFSDPIPMESWVSPFAVDSARRTADYQWETNKNSLYKICAFIPNSETSYWYAVNYGLVKKARALGVSLRVFHINSIAKDKPDQHKALINKCAEYNPDSVIIEDSFGPTLTQNLSVLGEDISLIAIGKNLQSNKVDASTSASYQDIGLQLANYMNQNLSTEHIMQTVVFPGDRAMQFVSAFIDGFSPKINSNKFHVRDTIYTSDSYLDIKSAMTRYLNANLDTSIIIGSAKVSQAAVEVLHEMSLTEDVQVISYELSAQVYRDIRRGKIVAALSTPPVVQGFLAIDMAKKLNEGSLATKHISPKPDFVDAGNILDFDISQVFAPYGYRETLEVN